MQLKPLNDRLVVEPIEQSDQTKSGLYLPDVAKEKPQTGKVIATGPGSFQDGKLIPMTVGVGDIVLFAKYSGIEVKLDGKKTLVMRESDVLAVVLS